MVERHGDRHVSRKHSQSGRRLHGLRTLRPTESATLIGRVGTTSLVHAPRNSSGRLTTGSQSNASPSGQFSGQQTGSGMPVDSERGVDTIALLQPIFRCDRDVSPGGSGEIPHLLSAGEEGLAPSQKRPNKVANMRPVDHVRTVHIVPLIASSVVGPCSKRLPLRVRSTTTAGLLDSPCATTRYGSQSIGALLALEGS